MNLERVVELCRSPAPSSFVNAAGILSCDLPATVVRKLDAAFHLARAVGVEAPAAAPGIDLPGWAFERPSGTDVIVVSTPNGKTWIAEPDDRLHMLAAAVIDASPKGGSDAPIAYMYRVHLKGHKDRGGSWSEVSKAEYERLAVHADDHYDVERGVLHAAPATGAEVGS